MMDQEAGRQRKVFSRLNVGHKDFLGDLFECGKCDEVGRPGTGSKLYYINSWAMCWPSDHPKKPVTG